MLTFLLQGYPPRHRLQDGRVQGPAAQRGCLKDEGEDCRGKRDRAELELIDYNLPDECLFVSFNVQDIKKTHICIVFVLYCFVNSLHVMSYKFPFTRSTSVNWIFYPRTRRHVSRISASLGNSIHLIFESWSVEGTGAKPSLCSNKYYTYMIG